MAATQFVNHHLKPEMLECQIKVASLHEKAKHGSTLKERQQVSTLNARKEDETVTVWRIENFDKVEVPKEDYGQFYEGDSYIVDYAYKPKNKREEHVLYFWLGDKSTADERGTAAMKTTNMDSELYNGRATQVRVVQGKEPLAFVVLFEGRLIVHRGGAKSGFRTKENKNDVYRGKDEGRSNDATEAQDAATLEAETPAGDTAEQAEPANKKLYHLRGTSPLECTAQEVFCCAASLNSNDAFVLLDLDCAVGDQAAPFVWLGKGASEMEEEFGLELCHRLRYENPITIREGTESDDFWESIGGKTDYATSSAMCDPDFAPRLFKVSNSSGSMRVGEIEDFGQQDLSTEDVMLLDVRSSVFVWIGDGARREEVDAGRKIATEYIETAADGRGDVPQIVVKQGHEPLVFICHFLNWNENPAQKLSQMEAEAEELEVTAEGKHFSLQELQEGLPPGVLPSEKEKYLTNEDFEATFKMKREEFDKLAAWKKTQLKKQYGLF